MPGNPLIALLISPASSGNRQLLQGITAYARQHARWRFVLQEMTADGRVDGWLLRAQPAGAIAEITSRGMARTLRRLGVPVVDVQQEHPVPHVPQIICDDRMIVRRGVDHLLDKGLRHLAFVGDRDRRFAMQRRLWFSEIAPLRLRQKRGASRRARVTASVAMLPAAALLPGGLAALAEWLAALPRPVGVVACNDEWGAQVLRACSEYGLHVPDDVAVVGVGNDPIHCQMSDPPLSSIDCHAPAIGFEAAAILDRMIGGGAYPPPITFIDPGTVQDRSSTDVLAISDQQAVTAVRFLRTHACAGITPAKAAAKLGISRRTLERLFARHVGHSPAAEIGRARLERVRELLAETDLSLGVIARRVGIGHVETLHRVFKKRFGTTPGGYRRTTPGSPTGRRTRRRRLAVAGRRGAPIERAKP